MQNKVFNRLTKNQIIFNTAIWVLLLILFAFPFGLSNSFATIAPIIPAVYIHFYLVKRFFKKRKYIPYLVLTSITIFVFAAIADGLFSSSYSRVVFQESIIPFEEPLYFNPYYMPGFNPFIGIVIASILSFLDKKQRSEIQEIKTQKIKAELDLLKSQVNPHFFFNTLNTLYSMVTINGDEETAEGISQLSGLMRYMIYDTQVDMISLTKEIEHINNFIELQKLRFSDDDQLKVSFEILGDVNSKTVPPMLFIPFIENAYKHGFSVKQKSEIFIQINIDKDSLRFRAMNTINKNRVNRPKHSGIGIENVKKRLDILFPKNHELKIFQDNGYFNVNLNFPI